MKKFSENRPVKWTILFSIVTTLIYEIILLNTSFPIREANGILWGLSLDFPSVPRILDIIIISLFFYVGLALILHIKWLDKIGAFDLSSWKKTVVIAFSFLGLGIFADFDDLKWFLLMFFLFHVLANIGIYLICVEKYGSYRIKTVIVFSFGATALMGLMSVLIYGFFFGVMILVTSAISCFIGILIFFLVTFVVRGTKFLVK